MKILTGGLSGQRLYFRPNADLRPTSDKVRMAIVNVLKSCLKDSAVLDLFSGTGALGFEALSMGASSVVFVEKNAAQAREIEKNLRTLGLEAQAEVWVHDALGAPRAFETKGKRFDIVFADPPYGKDLAFKTLEAIEKSFILNADAIVVLECGKKEKLPDGMGRLRCVKEKDYGDTRTFFYRQATFERSC